MSINQAEIEKAMDSFVGDDFVTAKEIVAGQIRGARDSYLRDKLGLREPDAEIEIEDPIDQDDEGEE